MANTTNLDLVKPAGTDHALVSVINQNSDKIDAFAGKTNAAMASVQDGIAIVADGDTHAAIASGQFVYVKNHSTLAEGLYRATAAIATDAALSTSNLAADSSGGMNALKNDIDTLNSKFTQAQIVQIKNISTVYFQERSGFAAVQNGRLLTIQGYVNITTSVPEGTDFATIGITSTNGVLCAVHINDHAAYIVSANDGKLRAGENLPTGYYYIIGSLWIMP